MNGKQLKMRDGIIHVDGAIAQTEKKHLAIRNAIEAHRQGEREPLAIPHGLD